MNLTCHVSSLENFQVSLKSTRFDDGFVSSLVIPVCSAKYDVVSNGSVLQPCHVRVINLADLCVSSVGSHGFWAQ